MWDKIKKWLLVGVLVVAFILGIWAIWKFIIRRFFIVSDDNEVQVDVSNPNRKEDIKYADSLEQALDAILKPKK